MSLHQITDIPKDTLDHLLQGVPFYMELAQKDASQLALLFSDAQVLEVPAGEEVIHEGDQDKTFYFLLRGQLEVFADVDKKVLLNTVVPGQVFGAISIICDIPRTATICAEEEGSALIFAADFSMFGELTDFSRVRLATKLAYYRMVVHSTRWRIELYRLENRHHHLAKKMGQIEIYNGNRDTLAELESLNRQVYQLTGLLQQWNSAFFEDEALTTH